MAWHRRQALLPLLRPLLLLVLQPHRRPRRLLLPHQHRYQRLAGPLLRHLFRPMSVLADGVEQMGMVKPVRVAPSGDAVQAMGGVAMMNWTTVDCRGVASRSSERVLSQSLINGAAKSVKLLDKCSNGLGELQDSIHRSKELSIDHTGINISFIHDSFAIRTTCFRLSFPV